MGVGLPHWAWALPLVSATVWLAMLLAMLIDWEVDGHPIFVTFGKGQTIAYISDIGAEKLRPLFIAGSSVTVVLLDASFLAERWLRHRRRLAPNVQTLEKVFSTLSIIAAVVGAAGIILLSIFDVKDYKKVHDAMLGVFIAGYVVSAIFTCAEYQRLGMHFRQHRILRASFWIKLFFILIELALAIAFGVTNKTKRLNAAAVLEWTIAFIFTFYILTFFMDLWPARHKNKQGPGDADMVEAPAQYATHNGSAESRQPLGGSNPNYANPYRASTPSRNF